VDDWRGRARQLADRLVVEGVIADPAWREAFAATPRHMFVPRFFEGDQEALP
jgi:protein-L-isoaspartate O-methyltransferase